jgi:uncharacterized cupredoxin-like copper-binding protein
MRRATNRPTRRARRGTALALTAALAVATAACSDDASDAKSGATSTTSPEERIVSDAEVIRGLADVRELAGTILDQLGSDPAEAERTAEAMNDRWFEFEGTVRKRDVDLYLQMEDGLSGIKAGIEKRDIDRVQRAKDDLDEAAEAYLAAAPEGDGTDDSASGPTQKVPVSLSDYKIAGPASSAAGRTTFEVANDADQVHEFVVVRTTLAPEALPLDEDGLVDEQGAGLEFVDEVEDLEAGKSASLTVDLTAGSYLLLCNLPEHYAKGMVAPFAAS